MNVNVYEKFDSGSNEFLGFAVGNTIEEAYDQAVNFHRIMSMDVEFFLITTTRSSAIKVIEGGKK